MLQIFHNPRIDFMGMRRYGYLFSAAVLVASLLAVGWHLNKTGQPLNYGIDFRGGTMMLVRFAQAPDQDHLRKSLEAAGFKETPIQSYGPATDNSFLIRVNQQLEENRDLIPAIRAALSPAEERARSAEGLIDLNAAGEQDLARFLEQAISGEQAASPDPMYGAAARAAIAARNARPGGRFATFADLAGIPELTAEMRQHLESKTYLGTVAFLRVDSVGPAVGKDLRNRAVFASLMAIGFILLYLWFRFELRFGVAAVVCLAHDVIFITGVFALTDREFDLTVLAAILTVIGYSVNDTVVVFDRVRSNLRLMRKTPLETVLNTSINQTLSRTILTSSATLFVVIAIYFYGGQVLNGFAFALLIGILEGTYSSIFVAAPLLLVWRRLFDKGN